MTGTEILPETQVVFLGVDAVTPAGGEDTASFVINRKYLVDTGWYGTIKMRSYGLDPLDLEYLFLTHCHHDHYIGLPHLLFYLTMRGHERPDRTPRNDRARGSAPRIPSTATKRCTAALCPTDGFGGAEGRRAESLPEPSSWSLSMGEKSLSVGWRDVRRGETVLSLDSAGIASRATGTKGDGLYTNVCRMPRESLVKGAWNSEARLGLWAACRKGCMQAPKVAGRL